MLKIIKEKFIITNLKLKKQTGCAHYHSDLDIVSIKFKCCDTYFPCYFCHESTGHSVVRWEKEDFKTEAILCGKCDHTLTIHEYLNGSSTCPYCQSGFNPNCSLHWGLYFDN